MIVSNRERMNEPGKVLHVAYVGIGPYDQMNSRIYDNPQYFGSILVECSAPKTASDAFVLEEWLRDSELPNRGRLHYSQLAILNWIELDSDRG